MKRGGLLLLEMLMMIVAVGVLLDSLAVAAVVVLEGQEMRVFQAVGQLHSQWQHFVVAVVAEKVREVPKVLQEMTVVAAVD
jgi:hypothetical protein